MNRFPYCICLAAFLSFQFCLPAIWASTQSQKELQHANNLLHNHQTKFARQHLNEALKLDPNDIDVRSRRASVFLDLDEDANALADIEIVLKARKRDTFAYEMRATVMYVFGKYEQALADISKSLQYATDTESKIDRLYRRADLYRFLKKPEKALADVNAVFPLLKTPDRNFYFRRGNAYFDLGDYKKAAADYSLSIERMDKKDTERGRYYGLRADAYEKMGRLDLAAVDRQRASDYALETYYTP